MAIASRTLHNVRLLVTGTVLMLTVSLATAAIVMWIPESPVNLDQDRGQELASNLSEYVLLHRGRNQLVPPYVQLDVDPNSR